MVPRRKAIECTLTPPLFSVASLDGEIESDVTWREIDAPAQPLPYGVPPFAAVDYESFYRKKYSLEDMSPWEYVTHPLFSAYLVSLTLYDGQRWWSWVGKPELAPWSDLPELWTSHNASFDELVHRRLLSLGLITRRPPVRWECTADLAAFLQLDRALDAVAPVLIGETADKTTRARMRDGGAGPTEVRDYAGRDSRQCAFIFAAHGHLWSELEREVARLQRRANYAGFHIDRALMAQARQKFTTVMREVAGVLPWTNRYPVASLPALRIECAKRKIPAPDSLSLDDAGTLAWVRAYDEWNWLESIRRYTKAQQQVAHIDLLLERARKDDTVPFELVYRKAPHTARFQSAGRMRLLNLDRDEFEGYNPRWYINCPPGDVLFSGDLSQIEPRVLNWLVGDEVFLDACRRGQSPYDAHARSTMGYTDPRKLKEANAGLYALAKARVLALGYQAGPEKFCEMARTMAGIIIFENERSYCPDFSAKKPEFIRESQMKDRIARNDLDGWTVFPDAVSSVADFRANSPLIVRYWHENEAAMRRCVGGDYHCPLPNGEVIRYFDVRELPSTNPRHRGELDCWVVRRSRNPHHHKRTYGGKLVENRVQRVSRDILVDIIARIAKIAPRLLRYRWSVYDEINAYCKRSEQKPLFEAFQHEMSTAPAWARGLPLAAECEVLERYKK